MLKIVESRTDGLLIFSLSGRIQESEIPELQSLLPVEAAPGGIAFDLTEVRLVDREAVKFLRACQAQGIQLRNCPSYIREWIETGSDVTHEL